MKIDARKMEWIRKPAVCSVEADRVEIVTEPFTDLWQRTYYHFRNDNAPVLQMKTDEQFFGKFFYCYITFPFQQCKNLLFSFFRYHGFSFLSDQFFLYAFGYCRQYKRPYRIADFLQKSVVSKCRFRICSVKHFHYHRQIHTAQVFRPV